jgi:small ligand-binding sensory domain FIST
MPFAAALSTSTDSIEAFDQACSRGLSALGGEPALALMFFSPHHAADAGQLAAAARRRLGAGCVLGCMGESIVGNDREIEQEPALSLWLARWNKPVQVEPFHLALEETPDGYSLIGLPDNLEDVDPRQGIMLLLGDPFSFPAEDFLRQLNEKRPGLRVLGGMASGGRGPGQHPLLLNGEVKQMGAVGVLLHGAVSVRSIVSQGCRPFGRHYVITRARDNLILELGGKPPLEQLQALWQELNPRDQNLFQRGLHVGRVINEYQGEFHRGDFLVRNVLGLERESGALAITDRVRVGQTIQFHVRDSASADEDLHELLRMDGNAGGPRPAGALLFTCNGRGTRLFSEPHHDASAVQGETGAVPLAGFFAQGEIGPIGGQNFIHGFTASVVLFED